MSDNDEVTDVKVYQDDRDVEYEGELETSEESEDMSGSDFEESLPPVKKSRKMKNPPKQKRSCSYVSRKKLGISNTTCEVCFKDLESLYRLYQHR